MPVDAEAIIEVVQTLYCRVRSVRRDIRWDDRIVDDLGVDSLAAVDMIWQLEDHFQVTLLEDPGLAQVRTVGDLVTLIARSQDGGPR